MVFLVIVYLDSYIYIQNNITRTLYRGGPPLTPPCAQKMDPGPIETQPEPGLKIVIEVCIICAYNMYIPRELTRGFLE